MLILGLLGMYFDAAVVFVINSSLFFRLTMAILCFPLVLPLTEVFYIAVSMSKSKKEGKMEDLAGYFDK